MKLYLIRHGQTDMNKQKRVQGRNGLPLNEEGRSQALLVSEKLKGIHFDEVYSSPAERAVQTAQIATGIKPIIDERLNVFDLGSADGIKVSELKTVQNGLIPDPSIYSGVENPEDYIARVRNFFEEIVEKYAGNRETNVLVCGHKCTTGCISALIEGMPEDGNFLKLSSSNAEYKVFEIE